MRQFYCFDDEACTLPMRVYNANDSALEGALVVNVATSVVTGIAVSERPASLADTIPKHIYYVMTTGSAVVILLLALFIALYYILVARQQQREADEEIGQDEEVISEKKQTYRQLVTTMYSLVETSSVTSGCTSCSGNSGGGMSHSPPVSRRLREPCHILADLHILRDRVELDDVLMEGTFGRVHRGTLLSHTDAVPSYRRVFVKTVIDSAHRDEQVVVMQQDACLLVGLRHPFIAPPLAACVMDGMRPLFIYPYSESGNLKAALLRSRDSATIQLTSPQLVLLSLQILRGLLYLHRHKILHKDVASRNCLLDSGPTARLSDSALSRDIFPSDYQCLYDNENRPVRWLSIEALVERKFSPAADCWAFGITLWELITRGQTPYEDVDPFEMPTYLRSGVRMPQPANCPDKLFQLIATCWLARPDRRPKLGRLRRSLHEFYLQMVDYV